MIYALVMHFYESLMYMYFVHMLFMIKGCSNLPNITISLFVYIYKKLQVRWKTHGMIMICREKVTINRN